MPEIQTVPTVFISYKRTDIAFALKIYNDLEQVGLVPWIDQEHIAGGEAWPSVIQKALDQCKCMIVILSPASVVSREVEAEWNYFLTRGKQIIPIMITRCDIPFRLAVINYIDFISADYETQFAKLTRAIQNTEPSSGETSKYDLSMLVQAVNHTTATSISVRYRKKYDRRYYFIRSDVLEHYERFIYGHENVMVVTGKAGTGKSCFICGISDSKTRDANQLVWLQDCAHLELPPTMSIASYIGKTLNLTDTVLVVLRSLLDEQPDTRLVFVFDAVNEFSRRAELLKKLSEFAREINHPRIKVLITCRVPIWGTIKIHYSVNSEIEYQPAGLNSVVTIEEFSSDEISQVYERYRSAYKLKTPFNALSKQVVQFISKPLFLRLVMEVYAYEGKEIPNHLVLKDVFREYVLKCLGPDGTESNIYLLLQRAVELMYETAKRELEVAILRSDSKVGQLVPTGRYFSEELETETPIGHLLDEGLLSYRDVDKSMLKTAEMIFVTYERVFEFLLADIIIGPVDAEKIGDLLDNARSRSFSQLRGAAELALSFAITQGTIDVKTVVDIARRLNRPDSRQFLTDVIQTVYDGGQIELVKEIVARLSRDESMPAKQLTVQIAFQLRLDDELTKLAISSDDVLRDTAALFLYYRWNKARLDGRLDDAYEPLRRFSKLINVLTPIRTKRVLAAIISFTVNISAHAIDDPASLSRLFETAQKLMSHIPGLELQTEKGNLAKFASDTFTSVIIEAVAAVVAQVMERNNWSNDSTFNDVMTNSRAKRAVMDLSMLTDVRELTGLEEKIEQLLAWDNAMISLGISYYVFGYHVYHTPEIHTKFLDQLFMNVEENKSFKSRAVITSGLMFGTLSRCMRNETIPEVTMEALQRQCTDLFAIAAEIDENSADSLIEVGLQNSKQLIDYLVLITWGILTIEASKHRREGILAGSSFVKALLEESVLEFRPSMLKVIIHAIEKCASQGFPEYAVLTILEDDFLTTWQTRIYSDVIKALARIRIFYAEEVDSLMTAEGDKWRSIWDSVRSEGVQPAVVDALDTNGTLMSLAAIVNPTIEKMGGMLLFEMTNSGTSREFVRRLTRITLAVMIDQRILDIGHYNWRIAHNPKWDNFERWNIPRDITSYRPGDHENYRIISSDFITKHGRGMMFEDS